jgi:GH25 family lysozyme M1 (1,4-beta-N-acetylmuramidase)
MLDYERIGNGRYASPQQVLAWLTAVNQATGQRPILYSGTLLKLLGAAATPLGQFPLWWTQYTQAPQPSLPPSHPQYKFWEFTDGQVGPSAPAKVGSSIFNGDRESLFALTR